MTPSPAIFRFSIPGAADSRAREATCFSIADMTTRLRPRPVPTEVAHY